MPFGLGPAELIIILVIALVVFGPGKLPDLGRSLGKSLREFKSATSEITREMNETVDDLKKPLDDLKKPLDDLKRPIVDLKKPFEDIKRLPSEALGQTSPAEPEAAKAEQVCPQCSARNPATGAFCGGCGAKLT